jgi:hypothetical protein
MADDLEQQYRALVEPVRGYPMSSSARAAILDEIEATYRRELAALGLARAAQHARAGR